MKKTVLLNLYVLILTQCGKLYMGKVPEKIFINAFLKKLKVKELSYHGKEAVALTKNFMIIIFNQKGEKKKIIRTGIEI